jgi:DNA-directed RNA polymerase sigma subunit (sigma70/sigma32)
MCPNCGDEFSIIKSVKFWFWLQIPYSIHTRLEKRKQDTELEKLKEFYSTSADLTNREHFVCFNRTDGKTLDEVAESMNVTRERIRQIQSKALRKLTRIGK